MEHNQNRVAAINHRCAIRINFMTILDFFVSHWKTGRGREAIGSLTNDNGDVNESWNVAKGLDWQNNFARASRFFVHFFPVNARLRRENV